MLLLSVLAGVRTPRDLPDSFELPDTLSAFDRWLAASESRFTDLASGAERSIHWADPQRPAKTAVSLTYLHGFSASRKELSPVCEQVADAIGANVYFARLTGHGRADEAMAEASLRDWLVQAEEALAIGQALGEQVVVVGPSTGATQGAWLASRHGSELGASILLSPNFGPRSRGSRLRLTPGRRLLTRLLVGEYREWEPENAQQARYWTHRYPAVALFPMMELVRLVETTDLSANRQPTLVIYSPNDQVIRPDRVKARMAEMGGQPVESLVIEHGGSSSHHVLAGDIVSPMNTALVTNTVIDFLVRATSAARIPGPVVESGSEASPSDGGDASPTVP